MRFAKIRIVLFFSKERLRGKVFPFSKSILCFGCLRFCLNGLRKGFVLSISYLHAPDHPLNQRSPRRIIRCVNFFRPEVASDHPTPPSLNDFSGSSVHPMSVMLCSDLVCFGSTGFLIGSSRRIVRCLFPSIIGPSGGFLLRGGYVF